MRRGGDENVVRYAAPEEDEELDIDEKQPLSEVASRLDLLEVELDECRKELDDLMEVVNRLEALSPVEVALEAGEDFFDGVEEEAEEIREALDQASCANEADLEHGRSGGIGQVYQLAQYAEEEGVLETEVGVWKNGAKLGTVNTVLEVVPEADVSIIDLSHLELLGMAKDKIKACSDLVRGEVVVGQVELELNKNILVRCFFNFESSLKFGAFKGVQIWSFLPGSLFWIPQQIEGGYKSAGGQLQCYSYSSYNMQEDKENKITQIFLCAI